MEPLPQVLWIGGPPRSGKTTIARRIARRHGLRWYNADAHTWQHRDRALAAGNEAALRWEAIATVEARFAAAIVEGPRAESPAERVALLRYANDAVVSQCLAYLARPWATGTSGSMIRTFVCECDDPECDADVELSVAAFRRAAGVGPVLASDHRPTPARRAR